MAGKLGLVIERPASGRQVRIRFDSGEEHVFVWPTNALERVRFPVGSQLELIAEREVGVVAGVRESAGRVFYQINLPGGARTTAMEQGVRPAVITDPLALIRS